MPYPYTYFNPNKKEQVALGAGSLISALLGAASGRNGGDAAVRGLAGLTGGYGAGYQNYQDLMNTAFQRDMGERRHGQDVNQDAFRNDLSSRQFDQNVREYEEVDKPYRQAYTSYMNASAGAKSSPEDIEYENQKRFYDIKNKRLDTRLKSKELKQDKDLGKLQKEYDDVQQELVKLNSFTDYMNDSPDKQKRIMYLASRSKQLEKVLGIQDSLAIDAGMKEVMDKGVSEAFTKTLPEQSTAPTTPAPTNTQIATQPTIVRTGINKKTGKKVIQYSDGTIKEQ